MEEQILHQYIEAAMQQEKIKKIRDNDSNEDKKFFLKMFIIILITIVAYMPIFYFLDAKLSFQYLVTCALIMSPLVYILHYFNYANLSRIFLILASNIGVFFTSLGLGHVINSQQYCFSFMILSLLLFHKRSTFFLLFGCFISVGTAWLVFKHTLIILVKSQIPDNIHLELITQINFFGTAFMMAMFLYFFLRDSKKQQARISKLLGTSHNNFIALKKREKELNQMTQAIEQSAIVTITDDAGKILHANENFCQISGYTESELIGQNHRIINSGKHSDTFFKDLWTTIKSGNIWTGSIENRSKNGKHYFVRTMIAPLKDLDEQVERFMSIRFDITPQIMAERLLEEIQDVAKIGYWTFETATNKTEWSPKMYDLFPEDFQKGPPPLERLVSTLHPNDQEPFKQAYEKCLKEGQYYKMKFRCMHPNKSLWIEAQGKCTRDKTGKVIYISGTCQDISELMMKEELLQVERYKSVHYAKLASQG